ncbi:MAG: IPT/TIG domain-containing protein [Dehalococcoidia bacterium]
MGSIQRVWQVLAAFLLVVSGLVAVSMPPGAAAETKPCTGVGFQEAATSTGGTFDFSCAVDTTIMVTGAYALNNVPNGGSLTIDGGNRLTVRPSGGNVMFLIAGIGNLNKTLILKNMIIENWNQSLLNGSVISFAPTHNVIVENVTFRNNVAGGGTKGGVIFAGGALTVTNSAFINNLATGSAESGGGAIVAEARARSLSIVGSTFISNTAPTSGAISTTITTTITSSTFVSNTASRPVVGGESIESRGGAISLGEEFDARLVVSNSYFRENRALGRATLNIPVGGDGTGRGGAIYAGLSGSGLVTVTASAFLSNTAEGAGGFSAAPGAGRAEGGAIANRGNATPMWILGSTFVGNSAYGEGANKNPAGSGGAIGEAHGGAIFSYAGQTRITNSTIALNQAYGSSQGAGNSAAANGIAHGGGIELGGAAAGYLTFDTIYSNTVRYNGTNGQGDGAGVFVDGGATGQPVGTIIAKNTDHLSAVVNCNTPLATLGYNLSDVAGCGFTGTADVQNAAAPGLGPVQNNGAPALIGSSASPGVLLSMRPLSGSPALNTGGTSANGCPATDQRGVSRPQGAQCDKGAIEVATVVPTITSINPSSATNGGGAFTLTVNGANYLPFSAVLWNGSSRPTTYSSSAQLTAQIGASDIAAAGTANVQVDNGSSDGGLSNTVQFTITGGPTPTATPTPPPGSTPTPTATVGPGQQPRARVPIAWLSRQ